MMKRLTVPEKGWTRREFLSISGSSLVGAVLLGASGCGTGGGQEGSEGPITFASAPDPSGVLQGLVDRFNERNEGGIRVKFREMPADTSQYLDQVRTEFEGGGGNIDVFAGDVFWPPLLAAAGYIADISDRFTEDMRQEFLPANVEANTYEGAIYGVPWYTDSGLLYYRKDLLEEAGFSEPPATWDELKEQAKRVQQDQGVRYGFVFQGAKYEGGSVNGMEYIRNAGGDVLDGNSVVVNSPEAIRGLTIERSLVADGIAPEAVTSFKEQESHTAFLNGDSVFLRNWPYVYDLAADPEQSKIMRDQIGIAELPVAERGLDSTNVGGGWSFFINEASARQDEAWEFMRYMTSAAQMKVWAVEGGFLPTRRELYDDQSFLEEVPVVTLAKEAIQNTTTPPVSPYYPDMSLAMQEQFLANLRGDVTPEQAAQKLQSELENIIEQAG